MSNLNAPAGPHDVLSTPGPQGFFASKSVRETIESIAIAFVLAFLFRAFEAEAFVIPTGSMAPTLMGRHRDLNCPQCGTRYQVGNSEVGLEVQGAVCPNCRFAMELNPKQHPNQDAFSGDHILVNKFAYDLALPQRWDVIVFKYPGNAKMNYIKRLVGLPNETLKIRGGNVYTQDTVEPRGFHIARKPAHKVLAMMQGVDDTEHIPSAWLDAKWPLRWQPWSAEKQFKDTNWTSPTPGKVFQTTGESAKEAWIRFQNVVPTPDNWAAVQGQPAARGMIIPEPQVELVSDVCAYNNATDPHGSMGLHWVGDLVLECTAKVEGKAGDLILELIKSGRHYQCRINVATGEAQMAIITASGERAPFADAEGQPTRDLPKADTNLRGPGTYRLRLSNFDDELRLWINGNLVGFSFPATYVSPAQERPFWTPEEPGDLAPAAVGSLGLAMSVEKLRVFRDIYYIATKGSPAEPRPSNDDYGLPLRRGEIARIFSHPEEWASTRLFDSRREVVLPELHENQFLPFGDNSAQSRDGRLWNAPSDQHDEAEPYVERDLLIGKAMYIYWPHPWSRPPYWPDFSRMKLIH